MTAYTRHALQAGVITRADRKLYAVDSGNEPLREQASKRKWYVCRVWAAVHMESVKYCHESRMYTTLYDYWNKFNIDVDTRFYSDNREYIRHYMRCRCSNY